jgi:diguanylate cyclase
MLKDNVITLGLRESAPESLSGHPDSAPPAGGPASGSSDPTHEFLVEALSLIRDLLAPSGDQGVVGRLTQCVDGLASAGSPTNATSQIAACLAEARHAVVTDQQQRAERSRDMASLMSVVHEAMAAAGAEMNTLQDSLQKSTDRFDAIRQIDDPRILKARLVTEVIALKQIVVTRRRMWEQTEKALAGRVAVLERELKVTQHEAAKDPLTGIANRRTFERTCEEWISGAKPYFSMALLDVDDFKAVNDTHGHATGDKVLQFIGRTLATTFRANDLVARIGGDEFAVLASGFTLRQAEQRLRVTLEAIAKPANASARPPCTPAMSCGVVEFSPGDTVASLFERADEALYSAKKLGKNCLVAKRRSGPGGPGRKHG